MSSNMNSLKGETGSWQLKLVSLCACPAATELIMAAHLTIHSKIFKTIWTPTMKQFHANKLMEKGNTFLSLRLSCAPGCLAYFGYFQLFSNHYKRYVPYTTVTPLIFYLVYTTSKVYTSPLHSLNKAMCLNAALVDVYVFNGNWHYFNPRARNRLFKLPHEKDINRILNYRLN